MEHQRSGEARAGQAGSVNELSGTVIGPSVQAGTISGGVHFHEERHRTPPVPRQLLTPSPHFTNRRIELSQLDDLLDRAEPALAVLSGPGGVGKTALAIRWAHQVRDRFPDGHLYVDLGGFSGGEPVDPMDALTGFLRALGVSPRQIPPSLAEQAALYRTVTAQRSLLVVLDNAYSTAQARVLVPASPTSATIVTSRRRLVAMVPDGARLIEVAPLPSEDAVTLLIRAAGRGRTGAEPAPAKDLAMLCGGLPIALCVAAARLAARPRLSMARLAVDLSDEASRLGGLSALDGPSVQATFDVSYRFLDAAAAALYRRLALHPGPEFGLGPVVALTPSLPAPRPSAGAVEPLLEASLLQEVAEERFRFHDLLRLHAREKAEADDTTQDRGAAVHAMLEWYFAAAERAGAVVTAYRRRLPYAYTTRPAGLPTPASRYEALAWLDRERVNLVVAGRTALDSGHAELAWHLSDAMWPLFLYRKHYHARIEADRCGVAAARTWGNGWAEARMLWRLSRACSATGDNTAAERHARASMALSEAAGDARGYLEAKEALALVYRDTGHGDRAAEIFTQVLAASRRQGNDRHTGLTLINLGTLLPELGRSAEAIALLEEARGLFAGLSDVDPYNEGRVLTGLARACLHDDDLPRAERAAAEAEQRMRDLGSEFEQAEALHLRGQIAERRRDAGTARHHYASALRIFEALGSGLAVRVQQRLSGLRQSSAAPAADLDLDAT